MNPTGNPTSTVGDTHRLTAGLGAIDPGVLPRLAPFGLGWGRCGSTVRVPLPCCGETVVHEMAITQSLLDSVCAHAEGRAVHRVTVAVGALCAVVPEAMQFCFELAAEGTVAEGAELEIELVPGTACCRACGAEFGLRVPILLCQCGSADIDVLSGRELRIRSMEVSDLCAQPADAETMPRP